MKITIIILLILISSLSSEENKKIDTQNYIFKGVFLDQDNIPLTNVIVKIKIDTLAYSDSSGNFEFDISKYFMLENSVVLTINYVNFNTANYLITKDNFEKLNNYTFRYYIEKPKKHIDYSSTTGLYCEGLGAPKKTWYERFWDKIKRIF